jgi:CDGSH-type Zn-finger protein
MFSAVKDEVNPPSTGRFNKAIDMDSAKVVHSITLNPGEKCVVCRCWQSAKFPLCDGTHAKHNKLTGDNLGPVVITVPK